MKTSLYLFALVALVLSVWCSNSAFAQAPTSNVFVMTTMERAPMPEGGSVAEFDSLTQLYTDRVIKKNDLILSSRIVRHWWGHNNRDFVVMYEVKEWGDVDKAMSHNDELFQKAWSKEDGAKFNKAYNRYFTGKHSDEIYSEVKAGRK
jgi:hypothetical protein